MAAGIFTAKFKDTKFEQVQGYKISAAFTPTHGFQDRFYVYLWDCVDADKRFTDPVKVVDDNNDRVKDTLTLVSDDVTYTFPDIEIGQAEVGATRAYRYRLVEFGYSRVLTDRGTPVEIKVKNDSSKKLEYGRLKNDYTFSLDGAAEHLFGYRCRLLPQGPTVVRYSALRNKENSFLQKIIDVNKNQTEGAMPSFTVNFKQGKTEVTKDNLVVALIDESWGFLTALPLPSLQTISAKATNPDLSLVRLSFEDFTPSKLIAEDGQDAQRSFATSDGVETATFVFGSGKFPRMNVT